MTPPTSPVPPASEPTPQVLLTILESALARLLERGLREAAEESIRRVMTASSGSRSEAHAAPAPPDPRASAVVVPFPSAHRRSWCPND